jgi:hypothetical protein
MPNYRNVYKSDHLGVVDLEELVEQGKPLVFTVTKVKQEEGAMVAGSKGNFNIAYFKEGIKPLVLNSTNATTIRRLGNFGTDVDTWTPILVELYIDSTVKMKGQVVGGVRIRTTSPAPRVEVSDVTAIAALNAATDIGQLNAIWKGLSADEKKLATVIKVAQDIKVKLAEK